MSCCRPRARIAREIADNTSPVSVALTRQMMWRMLGADHPMEAHKLDSRGVYSRGAVAGRRSEGVARVPREAPAAVPEQGVERHAVVFSVVERTGLRVILVIASEAHRPSVMAGLDPAIPIRDAVRS